MLGKFGQGLFLHVKFSLYHSQRYLLIEKLFALFIKTKASLQAYRAGMFGLAQGIFLDLERPVGHTQYPELRCITCPSNLHVDV